MSLIVRSCNNQMYSPTPFTIIIYYFNIIQLYAPKIPQYKYGIIL